MTELLPELKKCLVPMKKVCGNYTYGNGDLVMLSHPLVIQVPYFGNAEHANNLYEKKSEVASQALEDGNWDLYLMLHEKPYRLQALLELGWWNGKSSSEDCREKFYKCLGQTIIDIDNLHEYYPLLDNLFKYPYKVEQRFMMDEEDKTEYDKLKNWVTVYRGYNIQFDYSEENRKRYRSGWSWTTDKKVAVKFARRNGTMWAREGKCYIAEGQVAKAHIISYFTGRDESEVFINPKSVSVRKEMEIELE